MINKDKSQEEFSVSAILMQKYFKGLVNKFFKILPMRENKEMSVDTYMLSLRAELMGCNSLISTIGDNSLYLSLLSILQYLIEYPELEIRDVRREVFNAISICNKLSTIYAEIAGGD